MYFSLFDRLVIQYEWVAALLQATTHFAILTQGSIRRMTVFQN